MDCVILVHAQPPLGLLVHLQQWKRNKGKIVGGVYVCARERFEKMRAQLVLAPRVSKGDKEEHIVHVCAREPQENARPASTTKKRMLRPRSMNGNRKQHTRREKEGEEKKKTAQLG